jgi:hypothetical protein
MESKLPTLPALLASHPKAVQAEKRANKEAAKENKVFSDVRIKPGKRLSISGFTTSANPVLRQAAQRIVLQYIIEKHLGSKGTQKILL